MSGASTNEILLVALLIFIVLLAPKVPRIGDAVGGLFDRRRGSPGGDGEGDDAGEG